MSLKVKYKLLSDEEVKELSVEEDTTVEKVLEEICSTNNLKQSEWILVPMNFDMEAMELLEAALPMKEAVSERASINTRFLRTNPTNLCNQTNVNYFQLKSNKESVAVVSKAEALKTMNLTIDEYVIVEEYLSIHNITHHYMGWINLLRGKRTSNRLLIISSDRVILLKNLKVEEKKEHLFDLMEIEIKQWSPKKSTKSGEEEDKMSQKFAHVTLKFKKLGMIFLIEDCPTFLKALSGAVGLISSGRKAKSLFRLAISPQLKLDKSIAVFVPFTIEERFLARYAACCSYYGVSKSKSFISFVKQSIPENSAVEKGLRVLDLTGFNLTSEEVKCIFDSLMYNTCFEEVKLKDIPLSAAALEMVAPLIECDTSLKAISLVNIITKEKKEKKEKRNNAGFGKFSNQPIGLESIEISGTQLSEEVIFTLIPLFRNETCKFHTIKLSDCGMSEKATTSLLMSMQLNKELNKTLACLDISGNTLGEGGSTQLALWLQNTESLAELLVENTSINLNQALRNFSEFPFAKKQLLKVLNLSRNVQSNAGFAQLKAFLASDAAANISALHLQGCGLNADKAYEIVKTLTAICDSTVKMALDISRNEIGSSFGANVAPLFTNCSKFWRLDVSGNDIGSEGVRFLAQCLSNNENGVSEIDISNILNKNTFDEEVVFVLHALLSSSTPIRKLLIRGEGQNKLKESLALFIGMVADADKLKVLDITGNEIGDYGAVMLGEMLRANETLEELYCSDNDFTIKGLHAISNTLFFNSTLKVIGPLKEDFSRSVVHTEVAERIEKQLNERMEQSVKFDERCLRCLKEKDENPKFLYF